MGIKTWCYHREQSVTAASSPPKPCVDTSSAEATPEAKLRSSGERFGHRAAIAMCRRRSTNDRRRHWRMPRCTASRNQRTRSAREAGNMVDLDSSPTSSSSGGDRQHACLWTRGALNERSLSSPTTSPVFASSRRCSWRFDPHAVLNVMGPCRPPKRILSAIVFKCLIIIGLVPLAPKGVKYRLWRRSPVCAGKSLIYGAAHCASRSSASRPSIWRHLPCIW